VSEESARWVGSWADALITVARPRDALARIVDAFRSGGGDGKPMFLQAVVVHAPEDEGRRIVLREWPHCALDSDTLADVALPAEFDRLATSVTVDTVGNGARISDSIDRHVEWLHGDRELGFSRVYLHDVSRRTPSFLLAFAPQLLNIS
jgi:hypothetical protein